MEITRRKLASLAAAAPASVVAPSANSASEVAFERWPDTPIQRLYREHCAIMAALEASPDHYTDEDHERLFYSRSDAVEAEMMSPPSTCVADLAAKIIVETCQGAFELPEWGDGALWAEIRAMTGTAL